MTALQSVAMGLVIVLVDADLAGFDAVPDLLGWALVLAGVRRLGGSPARSTLLGLAATSGLVSLALVRTDTVAALPESGGWLLSLPQVVFSFVLCGALPALLPPADRRLGHSLARLRWVFVLVGVGPVLLYGGGVDALLVPLALVTVGANLALVYLLFRAAGALARADTATSSSDPT